MASVAAFTSTDKKGRKLQQQNGMKTWRDILFLLPVLVVLSSMGIGWGVHQASLESQNTRIIANAVLIGTMQDKLFDILDRLARIETKLDVLGEKTGRNT